MMESYAVKKERLAQELKNKSAEISSPLALYKQTSNLFRPHREKNTSGKIDVRAFDKLIAIDEVNLTADVEGMITYESLVRETLQKGYLPTVVPELKSITVGGAVSGCGIESSSFQYGLVHESVKEMEVLLSSGEVVTCTPDNEHKDLFFALPNTFGSLGYILRLKIQITPAKKFVKVNYRRFTDPGLYFSELKHLCHNEREKKHFAFIEGVIFNKQEMFISSGEFVEEAPYTSNYRYQNIYYRSIPTRSEDYLTTEDYIWRWDTDWFWCSKVFGVQNQFLRLLCGQRLLNSVTYGKIMHFFYRHPFLNSLFAGSQKRESLIHDLLIPVDKAVLFFEFLTREIAIFPIWICPTQACHPESHYTFCPLDGQTLYIDFGFWDSLSSSHEEGYYTKLIEKKVAEFGGFKSLYSSSYYTEEQFWQIYDRERYFQIKDKYDPNSRLRTFYEKSLTRKASR